MAADHRVTDEAGYYVIPVHEDKTVVEACAQILNEEWKRSLSARISILEKSRDDMPLSLALVSPENKVIGHSRLVPVYDKKSACLILSVVVPKPVRGQGQGRRLMTLTEEYARTRGFEVMYLTTHDKQGFYERLGYVKSEQVATLGEMAHLADNPIYKNMINKMLSGAKDSSMSTSLCQPGMDFDPGNDSGGSCSIPPRGETRGYVPRGPAVPAPPPPPPPPPKAAPSGEKTPGGPGDVTWYKKRLK